MRQFLQEKDNQQVLASSTGTKYTQTKLASLLLILKNYHAAENEVIHVII